MKLPIVAYGDPVLKKVAVDIEKDYPELPALIENMFETMDNANGVGLAAPQIGLSIRLFVIDATPFADEDASLASFKKIFINPIITDESGKEWKFNEGCLSIPDIREDVSRKEQITISYFDENWIHHEDTFNGLAARVIQHEYDHIQGKLFTDRISPLKKAMLKGKLDAIVKGNVNPGYRMKFAKAKRK
ncbi:peptide deformylase [Pseudopedobacter saltans DSM 12145]|uniref:Peptide deformylase n=1 Tax=Pseudopedobacter saltans (strain ATCC 51119 / DSM 12145 / JCM 21818 / CCUG 39354 / LMG 10337 / NBRC 100064 / NCIMB 13643) TaxID=762903 RepID=F0S9H5_PSESL|nr:peptide deformylase [Pseudopedobacter saltans]ADY53528.1 peptide deformylase [Pseudopedobacter saltans DSM 12145]